MSKLLSRQGVRDFCLGLALLLATLALMFWPKDSMAAARDGLTLCYNVIIPSLFPFFVLSALVVDLGLAGIWAGRWRGSCARCSTCGGLRPRPGPGLCGGYPVGARTALQLYQKGKCTKTEAERLLAFCNNSRPPFILGVVGAGGFASSKVGVLLYLAHAAASVCVGLVFRFYKAGKRRGEPRRVGPRFEAARFTAAFTGAIRDSFLSTLNICAFVVFFTVVIRLFFLSGVLPGLAGLLGRLLGPLGFSRAWAERLLTGFFEIPPASGPCPERGHGGTHVLWPPYAGMGGAVRSLPGSVLPGGSGLSARTYILGKMLHGGLSALFVGLLARLFPLEAPVSSYLADQVESLSALDFSTALTISTVCAWVLWLLFFTAALAAVRKTSRKRRKAVL
jgi:sporulation integral membrane protein YlbJ